MPGLLKMLSKMKKSDKEARILILGLDNAGKTTILKKLAEEEISTITPTQGFNVKTIQLDGFRLNLWDLGGQQKIRVYWSDYFEGTDGLLYVIDSADKRRVTESGVELGKLLDEPMLDGVPVLVLANKQDLISALSAKDLAETMQLSNIRQRQWLIQPCSAKNNSGLKESTEWLLSSIAKHKDKKQKAAADGKSATATATAPAATATATAAAPAAATATATAPVATATPAATAAPVAAAKK